MKLIKALLITMSIFSAGAACGRGNTAAVPTVAPTEFAQRVSADKNAYVLDVRTPEEYTAGHLQNAHNLDWLNQRVFADGAVKLPKDSTIYVYCRSGRRSAEAAAYLADRGYKVVDLDGGYMAWEQQMKGRR